MGLAWRGSELRRGYKSDPNTEGAPDLRNRPATPPRFRPPIHPKPGGNVRSDRSAEKTMENAADNTIDRKCSDGKEEQSWAEGVVR